MRGLRGDRRLRRESHPIFGRRKHYGSPIHWIAGGGDEAAGDQSAHHALDCGRVHGDAAPQVVLRRAAQRDGFVQGSKLRWRQPMAARRFEINRGVPLVSSAQEKTHVIFELKVLVRRNLLCQLDVLNGDRSITNDRPGGQVVLLSRSARI